MKPASDASTVVALQFSGDIQTSEARLLDPVTINTLNVFDGKIDGYKLKYENGARGYKADNHRDCLKGWVKAKDNVSWNLYAREAGDYEVIAGYHGLKEGAGIKVELGSAAVSGKTSTGADVTQSLGTIHVAAGENKLLWRITDTDGIERLRPQAIILKECK